MATITLTWGEVQAAPDMVTALDQVRAAKAKSKAKSAATPLADCSWEIQTAEKIQGYSFQDILAGKSRADRAAEAAESLEDRVKRRLGNISCCLVATSGRGRWRSRSSGSPPFLAVSHSIYQQEHEKAHEAMRIARLSPEERQAEANAALSALRGQPGFVELHIPAVEK